MNSSPQDTHGAREDQAAFWAARLDGSELSAADRASLNAWLGENPAHRSLLSQYCQFSAELEKQLPVLVAAGRVALPPEESSPVLHSRRAWTFSASLAAAAVVVFGVWFSRPVTSVQKFATAVGQRQSITLADGTQVELDAHSSLLLENGRKERRVRLAEGQAFFVVSKDKTRPFIVETPAGSVRVTGTTFDVRSETPRELEIIVVEGSVEVHPAEMGGAPSSPVTLGAGDGLFADSRGVSVRTLSNDAVEDFLAWRQGQIIFAGRVPLEEALARFAHYHGRGLSASPGAAGLPVGGRYSLDDLDGFLAGLESSFPNIRVTRELSGTVRVSLRSER